VRAAIDRYSTRIKPVVQEYNELKKGLPEIPSESQRLQLENKLIRRAVKSISVFLLVKKQSEEQRSQKYWETFVSNIIIDTEICDVILEAEILNPGWGNTIWVHALQLNNILSEVNNTHAEIYDMEMSITGKEIDFHYKTKSVISSDECSKTAQSGSESIAQKRKPPKNTKPCFITDNDPILDTAGVQFKGAKLSPKSKAYTIENTTGTVKV